jgi:oligopeptide/dipeptide ABC transporter ATP-binding protein
VSALDVSTQAQAINLLEDLQHELGTAFLFIAHDLAVVRHVSDHIAVMYLGQLAEEGPADALYNAPTHPYTHALLSAIPVPNPRIQRTRPKLVLRGEIPSPANPPSGCRFRTRCPYVMDICSEVDPPAFLSPSGLTARCHLHTSGPMLAGAPISSIPSPN